MIKERRKIPRYLCCDSFSDSSLLVDSKEYSLVSVNFNRFGIGLYSNISIPNVNENAQCLISFELDINNKKIVVKQLQAIISNIRLTEVGHQYGIKFQKSKMLGLDMLKVLKEIEKHLELNNSPENRYGLF